MRAVRGDLHVTKRLPGRGIALMAVTILGVGILATSVSAQSVKDAIQASEATNREAQASQKKIDRLSDDTDTMAAEFRAAVQETKALGIYNRQLEKLIEAQDEEMLSLREQIDNVTIVGRRVMPLLTRMLDTLDEFISLDVPFLPEERAERLEKLREMMARADVTISEKYRRILEAYQIENDYGRNIEAYRGGVNVDGQELTVDFLRIGRLALLYQSLDGSQSGMWDQDAKQWVQLDDQYRIPIRKGLGMARKQGTPDLVTIPLPAAKKSEVKEG